MQIDMPNLTFKGELLARPCVYIIRNIYTKDFYVGSTVRWKRRWWDHRTSLAKGRHHARYLQRAWNKYGADAFEFFVVGYYDGGELRQQEQWWLDNAKCVYNSSRKADRPTMSAEAKDRQRARLKAVWASPELREAARQRALRQKHLPRGPMSDKQRETLKDTHRSKNRVHAAFGRLWSLRELAEEYGVKYTMLKDRVRAGWDVERAVTAPKREGGL